MNIIPKTKNLFNLVYLQLVYQEVNIAYKNGDGKVTYDKDNNAVTTGSLTNGQEIMHHIYFATL